MEHNKPYHRDPDYHLKPVRKPMSYDQLWVLLCASVEKYDDPSRYWVGGETMDPLDAQSFETFINAKKEEIKLFIEALKEGPSAIRDLVYSTRQNRMMVVERKLTELRAVHRAELREAIITGNDEFDAFRDQVSHHDYYWDYSDDGGVRRRGSAARDAILAIVKEKGGMFKDYWDHVVNTHNENMKRAEAEHAKKMAERQ